MLRAVHLLRRVLFAPLNAWPFGVPPDWLLRAVIRIDQPLRRYILGREHGVSGS